jgi:uncharacterized protein involved in exopolysaccharide biosynthesis
MSLTLLTEISEQMQDLVTVFRTTVSEMRQDTVDWEMLERRIAEELAQLQDNRQGELEV